MSRKLTVKQRKFADEYIKSGNATQSAIRAGYSKHTAAVIGNENLSKPYIRSYIDDKLDSISSNKIASAEEIMEYLTRVQRGEETETVVTRVNGSIELEEVAADIKDRIKAAELLGKTYSIFTDRKEIDVKMDRKLEDFFGDEW